MEQNQFPRGLFSNFEHLKWCQIKHLSQIIPRSLFMVLLGPLQNSTKLKEKSLRKLILDTCTKTAFMANKFFDQTDGVSMGSSLGPVLANIIMTEMEETIVRKLVLDETMKFYCDMWMTRYLLSNLKIYNVYIHYSTTLRPFSTSRKKFA